MRNNHLEAVREGRVPFATLATEQADYFRRIAWHFHRRWRWLPLDPADLEQEAMLSAWRAIERYVYRCPDCRRSFGSRSEYDDHRIRRHGQIVDPKPPLLRWVHGSVGWRLLAMVGEAGAYQAPLVWTDDRDRMTAIPEPTVPPSQDASVELMWLIESMRRRLRPTALAMAALMVDGKTRKEIRSAMGVAPNIERRIRHEVRTVVREVKYETEN